MTYMKYASYVCDYCKDGDEFPENDVREEYLCPRCGRKMWYLMTVDRDDNTGEQIDYCVEDERDISSPPPFANNVPHKKYNSKPTITCPYCQSANCKKISGLSKAVSVGLWGIFALGKTTKQWHCNNCGSDF